MLEGEWNSMYWTRDTIMSLEEYINEKENWERAMEHARAVMKKRREDRYGTSSSDDEEDDDDDEEEDAEMEDGSESLGGDTEGAVGGDVVEEGHSESSSEGATDVVTGKEGSASSKSKAGKAETESAAQVMHLFPERLRVVSMLSVETT